MISIEDKREIEERVYDLLLAYRELVELLKKEDGIVFSRWYDYYGISDIEEVESFHIVSGASRAVIFFDDMDYVVKIPFSGAGDCSLCKKEVKLFLLASDCNMEKMFAECDYLGSYNVLDIDNQDYQVEMYIMKKAQVDEFKVERISEEQETSFNYDGDWNESDRNVIKNFEHFYGIELTEELIEWLIYNGINDIHESNMGFIDGMPVLIDYAGY